MIYMKDYTQKRSNEKINLINKLMKKYNDTNLIKLNYKKEKY